MTCVSSFETTRGGVEVGEAGDSFEGEQERSDIEEWRLLLFGSFVYVEMAGLRGVLGDMPQ